MFQAMGENFFFFFYYVQNCFQRHSNRRIYYPFNIISYRQNISVFRVLELWLKHPVRMYVYCISFPYITYDVALLG